MKRDNLSIYNNENLVKLFMSYLNCKDMSQISQVTKILNRISNTFFDHYWRENCISEFCSNYDHNKIQQLETHLNYNNESESILNEYSKDHFNSNISRHESYINWKNFMRMGVMIKNGWKNFEQKGLIVDPILYEDITMIQLEIYRNLKEYFALPKLRKENHHVESDLNSIFQTYLYDFLYDQQDLYEYYNSIFYNKKYNRSFILVKNSDLPFANTLENFPNVIKEFQSQNSLNALAEIRWYNPITGNSNSENLTIKMIEKLQNCTDNRLLFILNCLNLTVTYFCQLSFRSIIIHFNNDNLFLNEYLKRYKSFVESAIYMNDYLENLNVLVNYTYETTHKNYPTFPKFSILRMMILTWNREVLGKLGSTENNKYAICEKIINQYSNYITREIKKINILSLNEFYFISNMNRSKLKQGSELYHDDLISDYEFDNISISSNSTNFSYLKNYSNSDSITNSLKNSLVVAGFSLKDDKNKSEDIDGFATSCLIEQICNALLDSSLNEYSVFNFNNSDLETNDIFKEIENGLTCNVERIIRFFYDENKLNDNSTVKILYDLLTYFKTSDFHSNRFNSKLKLLIYSKVYDNITKLCLKEIEKLFYAYKTNFNSKNVTLKYVRDYFKLYGYEINEKHNEVFDHIINLPKINYDIDNSEMVRYFAIYFIRDQLKIPISFISIFEETTVWYKDFEAKNIVINKQVEKERKRRNINSFFNETQTMMLSFEKTVPWEKVCELYIENTLEQDLPSEFGLNQYINFGNIYHEIPSSINLDLKMELINSLYNI